MTPIHADYNMEHGYSSFRCHFFLACRVLAGISYYFSQKALSHSIDDTVEAISADYADKVAGQIWSAEIQLESFSEIRRIYNPVDNNAIQEALSDCSKHLDALENVTYISPNGMALRPDGSMVNLADREYFRQVLTTKKSTVSMMLTNRSTGKSAFSVAVPVFNADQLTGVLTGSISLDKLRALIKTVKFRETGYAFMMKSKKPAPLPPSICWEISNGSCC